MNKKFKILVAAGGTGGHLFPAMAVVKEIEKLSPGCEFTFTGRTDKIEGRIIPGTDYKFLPINVRGLVKKFSSDTLKIPFQILSAYRNIKSYLKTHNYDAAICAGAYISYAPGVAASSLKLPLFLLEANVTPGKTIGMLSNKAKYIFTSFQKSVDYFSYDLQDRIIYTGNPVREDLLSPPTKKEACAKFGLNPDCRTILVFGGSLGAKSINNAVNILLPHIQNNTQIIWQTGVNYSPDKNLPANIYQTQFIDDMASAYAAADLVISRSGATTVAELEVVGKPSILVPLPSASNNEQFLNAKVLVENDAAIILENKDIEEKIVSTINYLFNQPEKLMKMGKMAKSLAKPDAAQIAAKHIVNYLAEND